MNPNQKNNLVEIFSGTILEAEMVKSLLENAEIECVLKDENTGSIAPWHASSGGTGSVKVIVSSLQYTEAKQIVEEYNNNTTS